MSMLILYPHQLFQNIHIKKLLKNKKYIHVVLFEHTHFFTKYYYHKLKLIFHRASMKNYFKKLKYKKLYVEYDNIDLLNKYIKSNSITEILFFNPIEKDLISEIENNKIFKHIEKIIHPSPYFLNSQNSEINNNIKEELTTIRHDLFYKYQRINNNILVKDNKPVDSNNKAGSWSYDIHNRGKYEKNHEEPKLLKFKSKTRMNYLIDAKKYVDKHFNNHYGFSDLENFIYPIDRTESMKWLKHFISHKLHNFGKYEDAIHTDIKFGYHSILSPLTNSGLITPMDIINLVVKFKTNIESKEGFIRQLIGWREYCYFVYDNYNDFLKSNSLYKSNTHKIPNKIWNCKTQIPIIDDILNAVNKYAYSHHIERLMCIGNFFVLIQIDVDEIYTWFQTMYIDAYDVFMIPNVYGMLCYGKINKTNHMMTKPYFSSSNYLMKMSNYKPLECVKINDKLYYWNDIFDALYWNHVSKYSTIFSKIYSTSSAVSRWNKFTSTKKHETTKLAKIYIDWIHGK
jgi:deoxyribodipyrimidine photolyase-related protein